jgi:hypothetical protein
MSRPEGSRMSPGVVAGQALLTPLTVADREEARRPPCSQSFEHRSLV